MREFREFAVLLAERSGEIIRQYFRTALSIHTKPDESPVTIADKRAEEVMRDLIMKEFPDHGIFGEEFGSYRADARYKWVLDPIDGTLNFIAGGWMFGTLIALVKDGQPILGVIHQPILGEMLVGRKSETTLNGNKVCVRPCTRIADAVLLTTDPYLVKEHQNFANFEALRKQVKVFRGWGDCYGYFLLVTGHIDVMIDPILNPWDIMALVPIVHGGGGTITDYHGDDPAKGTSVVATGGPLHERVIEILNRRRSK
ncbi:MAG: histidinol-phosphatase [bacterium]